MSDRVLSKPPKSAASGGAVATVTPLCASDVFSVRTLLADVLPRLYPGGDAWLDRRLVDVLQGHAAALVARRDDTVCGVVILSPKAARGLKLSTVFVNEHARSGGLGTSLVDAAVRYADEQGYAEMWVTVAHHLADQLAALLRGSGFTDTAFVSNRYGLGRHEVVFTRLS
jgi:ribosomal protein S18 acetylase RimI-like enzyme